jgi:hypothetical protein
MERRMNRFYFNFQQESCYTADDLGCEFSNVEEAYLAAVAAAREMPGELLARREDPRLCASKVADDRGNDLFALPFSELLDACRPRRSSVRSCESWKIASVLENQHIALESALAQNEQHIFQCEMHITLQRVADTKSQAPDTADPESLLTKFEMLLKAHRTVRASLLNALATAP